MSRCLPTREESRKTQWVFSVPFKNRVVFSSPPLRQLRNLPPLERGTNIHNIARTFGDPKESSDSQQASDSLNDSSVCPAEAKSIIHQSTYIRSTTNINNGTPPKDLGQDPRQGA